MLRLSSILTLQNVWETIPPQPSKVSSPTTLSRGSSVRTKPSSILVSTTEPPPEEENQEDPIPTSGSSCLPASLPASLPAPPVSPPASIHSNTTNATSNHSVSGNSNTAALSSSSAVDAVPSIQITHSDEEQEQEQRRVTTSSMFETPTKSLPPTKKSQSSPTNSNTIQVDTPPTPPLPPLPPQTHPSPPPVPSKNHKSFLQRKKIISHHDFSDITNINNEADDAADKMATTKSGRYHFLGPRSSAASANSPPSSIHSSALINGANKALRRESSKMNMRRKSFSKKLKKAISNIKLNGAGETASLHAISN